MPRSIRVVLVAVLLSSAASAAIRVTPELAIAESVPAPDEGWQRGAAVATDGTDFIVVWLAPQGLRVTHVTADGKRAGPHVTIATSNVGEISAVWTGSTYLATWRDGEQAAIMAAALARDGTLISAPRVVVRGAATITGALASNGRRALLAYAPAVTPVVAKAALLAADGSVLAVDLPLPSGDIGSVDSIPRVATDGNEFALVWSPRHYTLRLVRVSEDGSVAGSVIDLAVPEQIREFGVTFGGGSYAIAAMEHHLIKPGIVQPKLTRITVDAATGAVTRLPAIDTGGYEAAVVWNGSRFIAYWMNYTPRSFELLTLPFDAAVPIAVLAGARLAFQPRFASNGTNIFGAWTESLNELNSTEAILGTRFDASAGAMVDAAPSLLSVGWSRQVVPAIATSGLESLVVWVEESGGYERGRLVGARVTANGMVIDGTPFEIAPAAHSFEAPAVTFTGTSYLVVWREADKLLGTTKVVARTVGRDALLGVPMPLGVGWGVAAASNSSTTLVTFGGAQGIVAWRFNVRGELMDTSPLVIGEGHSPRVAGNGTDFFVAWNVGSDYWQWPSPDYIDVLGARVSAAGAVDASPVPIATGKNNQTLRAIGSDGRDYLVVYALATTQIFAKTALAAKRVLREGQLDGATASDDGTTIVSGTQPPVAAITADATGFWAAWFEEAYPVASMKLTHTDFRGNPTTPITLASLDSRNRVVAGVSLARAGGGPLQIAYARRVTEGAFAGTSRIFMRLSGEVPGQRSRPARR